MKSIFQRSAVNTPTPVAPISSPLPPVSPNASCRNVPAVLASGDGEQRVLKVEAALRAGDYVAVAGWALGPVEVRLAGLSDARAEVIRFARPDVAAHFERATDENHGWVIVAALPAATTEVMIEARDASGTNDPLLTEELPLTVADALSDADIGLLGPAAGVLAFAHDPFSARWKALVRRLPVVEARSRRAHGYLEAALDVRGTGNVVVVGWAVAASDALVWVEDSQGGMHPLDAAGRLPRHDVHALLGGEFGGAALDSGFKVLLRTEGHIGSLRLKAITHEGMHLLAEVGCKQVAPSPLAVATWLFGVAVPDAARERHYDAVSGPLLADLISRDRLHWQGMPVARRQLGRPVEAPEVSIVVPLYGRFDFVESQMLEWARDAWVRDRAELIYVVDDPAIVDGFRRHAEELHRLYGIPFQWVWGGVNRGFSGANNLGAIEARAPRLLFLNSDVFPQQPGWLQAMVDALDARADVGAVGPRLTFAEGGIQHAGMRFERLEEHGVWINRHPYMGLDPALDPAAGPTPVPALTGACLLVRSSDFEAVGGWDTGYLIGDFEDSDLCLKLRERGLASLYLPHVQLTHLERQSMSALGEDAFRMRITLWNAMRHQRRWQPLIEQAMETRP